MSQHLDLFFRAYSRARWVTVATNRGIYTGSLDEAGREIVSPGFAVDEIGNMMIAPPVYDTDGNITTPAVIDTWHSVNLRIYGPHADADDDTLYPGETDDPDPAVRRWRFMRSKLARFIRAQGTLVDLNGRRAYQFGTGVNRIQLLDPRDIATPYRVWAGGMEL